MSDMQDTWEGEGPDPLDEALGIEAESVEEPVEEPVEEVAETEVPGETPTEETSPDQETTVEEEAEPAEAVEETEVPDPQPEPSPAEADLWKQRYEGLRNSRENTAGELRRIQAEHQQLQNAVAQFLQMEQQRQAQPAPQAPQAPQVPHRTDAELAAMGFETREAYNAVVADALAAAQAQVSPELETLRTQAQQTEQQLAAERQRFEAAQQQQITAAEQVARENAGRVFAEAHPEYIGEDLEAVARREDFDTVVDTWNRAWSRFEGVGEFDWTDVPSLEIAAEAAARPALASVLSEMPHLFESHQGLELARQQARLLEAPAVDATQPKPKRVDAQAVDAQLKAAHTEPAGSGPAPAASRDELDDALDLWKEEQARASFG